MLVKLSNLALTLGYFNPALNNSGQRSKQCQDGSKDLNVMTAHVRASKDALKNLNRQKRKIMNCLPVYESIPCFLYLFMNQNPVQRFPALAAETLLL